jgi:hypothetical protein
MLACSLPGVGSRSLQETQMALSVQQTLIVQQQTQVSVSLQQPDSSGKKESSATPTEFQILPTYTPYPTYTPVIDATTQVVPTSLPTEAPTQENVEDRIRGANILIFEDVKGYYDLTPWVHQAVSSMDFSGGKIVEVGDAVGEFMKYLNSPVKWDLIIVAAEIRTGVRGEFWDVILDQVNDGSALIAEVWYLDEIASGRISPLLGKCGIRFQKDWYRDPGDNALDYSLYWLDQHHPIFSQPNVVGPLYTPTLYWTYDAGDLLSLDAGGDAELLAGLYPKEKSKYGVLATCMGGRVVFQTFSTHDYRSSQVIPLWQNYITYTLTNHFEQKK